MHRARCFVLSVQLEELSLWGNKFSGVLNPAIGRLRKLKRLDLDSCELASLPDWIGDLEQLEDLSLSRNNFSGGLNPTLGRLRLLKKLDLELCELTALPESFGDLEQLDELSLSGNNFSGGLIVTIGRLRQLRRLFLNRCELTSLPDSIGDLKQLEDLSLWSNKFSRDLNPAIRRLRRLKRLDLDNSELTNVPGWIGDLEQLEELWLSKNNFSGGLNEAIGRLGRLERLVCNGCALPSLPDSIGDLAQLEDLSLWNNKFSSGLNPAIGRLRRLKKLDLDDCELPSLPDDIRELEQLESLKINNNRLEEYPRCTLHLKKLLELDLSNDTNSANCNGIKSLPVELAFTNLTTLNIRGNPITEPAKEIWSQGIDALKSFMRAVIPGGELMRADTINMIGDTCAGKTSVAQSLIARSPVPTAEADRTHLLHQRLMRIDDSMGQSVIINDFGGHKIYHSVMPLFLPTNGLLIIVYNMLDTNQEQTVRNWMLTAIAKSSEIRLIIVGTRAELVGGREHRLNLEEQMRTLSGDVWQSAIQEISAHIIHLECQPEDNGTKDKLDNLRHLCENLKNARMQVVTLSCTVPDEGLSRLHNFVLDMLRSSENLPLRWCKVINEIFGHSPDLLYITMEQVEDICLDHFTNDDDSRALKTILRYLANASKIIWLEHHPLLRNIIFHSPQKIIDTCKKILHHDYEDPNIAPYFKEELKQYKKGKLQEPLLRKILSAETANISQSEENAVCDSPHSRPLDVIISFLQKFNLISCVLSDSKIKEFIVPSNLASTEPQRLHELEETGHACLKRVTVRLSFIGSIVPMSLFETSLSSMLTVASGLDKYQITTEVWKDGIIILHDEVSFFAKQKHSDAHIFLTAFTKRADRSPWTILHPVLKHLNDNVIASWHGAPPKCAILCPWCLQHNQSNEGKPKVGKIRVDLTNLVANDGQCSTKPTCKTCTKAIPRGLCFPTTTAGTLIDLEREIKEFFSNTESGSEEPCAKLEKQWKRSTGIIKKRLTCDEIQDATDDLFSSDHVTELQWEQIKDVTKRGSHRESATAFVEIVGRCGPKTIEKCLNLFESEGGHLSELAQSVRSAHS